MTQERFQHWFFNADTEFARTSNEVCNVTLALYRKAYASTSNHIADNLGLISSPTYELCRDHASCILGNTTEYKKATLATGIALLGLLPLVIVTLAPSLTELALLSVHRPGLAFVLSIASPAILVDRVLLYRDPSELLATEHKDGDVRNPLKISGEYTKYALGLGIMQYISALAAVANTLYLVYQLSVSSVLSWGCTRTWPLYFWMFLPVVFHLLASIGYSFTLEKSDPAEKTGSKAVKQSSLEGSHVGKISLGEKLSHSFGSFAKPLQLEFTSCVGRLNTQLPSRTWISHPVHVQIGISLSDLATFFAFFHMIFAIITFSGLLFVTAIDAIGSIGMRLVFSSLVCRIIVMVELGGLRGGHQAT